MRKIIYIGIVFALLAGFPVQANVSNEVNVSASTASNGKSETHIFIKTTVDGEVVEKIDKHVISEGGEPIELREETSYESVSEPIKEQSEEEAAPVESAAPSEQEDITTTNIEEEEGGSHILAVWFDLLRSTFLRYGNYLLGIFRV